MEYNIEKKSVNVNEIILEENVDLPVEGEMIIPDYCPEVMRILNCSARLSSISKKINNNSLYLDINVVITIIYTNDNNEIYSLNHSVPIFKELPLEDSNIFAHICNQNVNVNCRAIDPRKVEIRGSARFTINIVKNKNSYFVSSATGSGIQTKDDEVYLVSSAPVFEKSTTITDDFEPETNSSIRSIITSDVKIIDSDCSVVSGNAIVKGEAEVNITFSTDDNTVENYQTTLPFSEIIEIISNDSFDKCRATCTVDYWEARTRTGSDGTCRNINLSVGLAFTLTPYNVINCEAVRDAFSTMCNLEIIESTAAFPGISRTIEGSEVINNELVLPNGILEVLNIHSNIVGLSTKTISEGISNSGYINHSVLYLDKNGTPTFYQQTVPFEFDIDADLSNDCCLGVNQTIISKEMYTITGDNTVDIRSEIVFKGDIYQKLSKGFISDIEVDECCDKPNSKRCTLTIYYASKGEDVFNIAKKYKTDVDSIIKSNDISGILKADTMLLIPCAKP